MSIGGGGTPRGAALRDDELCVSRGGEGVGGREGAAHGALPLRWSTPPRAWGRPVQARLHSGINTSLYRVSLENVSNAERGQVLI